MTHKAAPLVATLDQNRCCGCLACVATCCKGSLIESVDSAGFSRPVWNKDLCVGCGACDSACPALSPRERDERVAMLWAQSIDSSQLRHSSSGGLFALLADKVLDSGGTVYGAAFSDDFSAVEHIRIDDSSDLDRLMTSKYVQSRVSREVYESVVSDLVLGQTVLFSGAGCQIAALKGYLGRRKYNGTLLTVDVMCHGVPSPRLWSDYAEHISGLMGAPLSSVNFRSKTSGWTSYSLRCKARNEKEIEESHSQNWYMKAFLTNHSLRSSCFNCPSKQACGSDLTLGDYWGYEGDAKDLDIEKGVSAVIVRTKLGEAFLDSIASEMRFGIASYEDVSSKNPALEHSVTPPPGRDQFISDVSAGIPVASLISKWSFKRSVFDKVKSKLAVLLKKNGR